MRCRLPIVFSIFVQNGVFGPGVVNSVLTGSNYIRGKRGMLLMAEVLQRLQFEEFASTNSTFSDDCFTNFKQAVTQTYDDVSWENFEEPLKDQLETFETFVSDSSKHNH